MACSAESNLSFPLEHSPLWVTTEIVRRIEKDNAGFSLSLLCSYYCHYLIALAVTIEFI